MDLKLTISKSNVTESSDVIEAEQAISKTLTLTRDLGQVSLSPGILHEENADNGPDFAEAFTERTWKEDFALSIENRKLYVTKAVLALYSPVFDRMFQSEFNEKNAQELELPGKKFEDVQDFLRCIYPGVMADVSEENVYRVLPLAEEYQVDFLKSKCEQYLLQSKWRVDLSVDEKFDILGQAAKYNMEKLLKECIEEVSKEPIKNLDNALKRMCIPLKTICEIQAKMVRRLETFEEENRWYEGAYKVLLSDLNANEIRAIEKCKGWTCKSLKFSFSACKWTLTIFEEPETFAFTLFGLNMSFCLIKTIKEYFLKFSSDELADFSVSVFGRLVIKCGIKKNEDFVNKFEMTIDKNRSVQTNRLNGKKGNVDYLFDETEGFIHNGEMKAEIHLLAKQRKS